MMPCRIECDQPTVRAKEYFWPTIKNLKAGGDEEQGRSASYLAAPNNSSSNSVLTASFRGRPLQGTKVKIPESYKGFVLGKKPGEFEEFTYWNWDQLPSKTDAVVKALQWINVSDAIHS